MNRHLSDQEDAEYRLAAKTLTINIFVLTLVIHTNPTRERGKNAILLILAGVV
jgi:hypothetical protein